MSLGIMCLPEYSDWTCKIFFDVTNFLTCFETSFKACNILSKTHDHHDVSCPHIVSLVVSLWYMLYVVRSWAHLFKVLLA